MGVGVGDGVPGFAAGGLGGPGLGELGRLIGIARGAAIAELDDRAGARTPRVPRAGGCAWRRGSATTTRVGTTSCFAASTDGGRTTSSAPPVNARAHR